MLGEDINITLKIILRTDYSMLSQMTCEQFGLCNDDAHIFLQITHSLKVRRL